MFFCCRKRVVIDPEVANTTRISKEKEGIENVNMGQETANENQSIETGRSEKRATNYIAGIENDRNTK